MATLQDLEHYLHEHIPLSRAMQAQVLAASTEGITLGAPLAPNINHRETVFGGSASALAILAAWALVHTRLRAEGIAGRFEGEFVALGAAEAQGISEDRVSGD